MRKKIYLIPVWVALLCMPGPLFAQSGSPQAAFESLKQQKDSLAERERLARIEEDGLSQRRKKLDIELQDIANLRRTIAQKERQLKREFGNVPEGSLEPLSTELLKKKLESQNTEIVRARAQLEEQRNNLAIQTNNLKEELNKQDLERRLFLSRQKEKARDSADMNAQRKLQACRQALERQEKEQELLQRQIKAVIEKEDKASGQHALQDKLDSLLKRQQKLLDSSSKVEQDLRRQKEYVQNLMDHARAATLNPEIK